MNLNEHEAQSNIERENHAILVYGHSKTGKTWLVGTAAQIPEVKRIVWVDVENGSATLSHMGLTTEEKAKIILIKIPDTREVPRAIETVLKMLSSKDGVTICYKHGKIDCKEPPCINPITKKSTGTFFRLQDMTHEELLVIDTGSQLGDSALALATIGKDISYKPTFDDFGEAKKYLHSIFSVLQAAVFTNPVVISHMIAIEEEYNGIKRDKFYPMVGSRAFSQVVASYFGTVVLTETRLGKHIAGSSSTYKADYVTGSRLNIKLEGKEPTMKEILITGGVLKEIGK